MVLDRPANLCESLPVAGRNGDSVRRSESGAGCCFESCFFETIGTSMQSTFDERNWLAWLVKVRILILTFLLGIQLAVAELTPTRLPLRLFISTIFLWYTVSLFYVVLLSFWQEHRLQASLQVLTDLIMVSLVVHETGAWAGRLTFF